MNLTTIILVSTVTRSKKSSGSIEILTTFWCFILTKTISDRIFAFAWRLLNEKTDEGNKSRFNVWVFWSSLHWVWLIKRSSFMHFIRRNTEPKVTSHSQLSQHDAITRHFLFSRRQFEKHFATYRFDRVNFATLLIDAWKIDCASFKKFVFVSNFCIKCDLI